MDHISIIIDVAPIIGGVLTIGAALVNAAVAVAGWRRERSVRPTAPAEDED